MGGANPQKIYLLGNAHYNYIFITIPSNLKYNTYVRANILNFLVMRVTHLTKAVYTTIPMEIASNVIVCGL